MKRTNLLLCMLALFVTGLLTACGGGGGGDATVGSSTGGVSTGVTNGVAVDPYIVGAVFEEIGADGLQKQSASTPTDSLGRFRFANAIQEGSTIRIKSSSRGMHGNSPFQGILKRTVQPGDSGSLVVTPLTTLVANGMTENEVISMLSAAGISGLTTADISADPMQGLAGATTGVTDAKLNLLKANMAVNTMLQALQDYNYAGQTQSPVSLADCVALSNDILNAADFSSLSTSVSNSLGGTFSFDDLAKAAVDVQNTVVAQLRQDIATGNGTVSSTRFNQLSNGAVANLPTIATAVATARIGNGGTGGGGQTVDAAAIFNGSCTDCHNLGTGTSFANLTGDGALVNGQFGNGATHNMRTLTAEEITAMADYLNGTGSGGSNPPPAAVTGSDLYTQECQGCHGSLTITDISNRTFDGIKAAIVADAGPGMGSIALTDAQLTLVANALPTATQPPPTTQNRTGVEVYDQDCANCHMLGTHDTTGFAADLASKSALIITKIEGGHRANPPNATELAALADYADTFGVAPPPVVARTPEAIYNNACGVCHELYNYDAVGNGIDLAGTGSIAVTKVAGGHGGAVSTDELTALAAWLDTFSPAPPPAVARDGKTVYDQNCAVCHELYGYDAVGNGIDLASKGGTTLTKLANHGGSVSAEETQNIATWLDTFSPAPPPLVDRNGETVYNENCNVCHKLNGYDSTGNVELASKGNLVDATLATGHGGTVSAGEAINIADWLDTFTPPAPPVIARTGQTVYDDDCLGCHKVNGYDATGTAPDIAGNGAGAVIKINGGHKGVNLLAEELTNIEAWLNTFQPGDPYTGSCNACHGQPPTTGAHEVHTSLADIGTDCDVCHTGADHNGSVDLTFQSTWNAKSGSAGSNGSTCSSVKCHGGGTTPNWLTGSINSSTQCSSCHSRGTTEYNSYNSGEHRKHVSSEGYSCDACHDPAKLANGHFGNLSTVSFEQSPSTTIKSSLSYSGGRCSTPRCHGGETW